MPEYVTEEQRVSAPDADPVECRDDFCDGLVTYPFGRVDRNLRVEAVTADEEKT